MSTLWSTHRDEWSDCQLCPLSTQRKQTVLYRGKAPCDVLFVGEAPGESEDALGVPFVGPAGKLLDRIIESAGPGDLRLGFTNLVACFPKEAKHEGINEPPVECVRACEGRLRELILLASPRLIVTVGAMSDKYTPQAVTDYKCSWVKVTHPAAILRANIAQRGLMVQRATVVLANAFDKL